MASISVIGLGKLGAPLLATIASRGFKVYGIDIREEVVKKVNRAKAPVDEPYLVKLIKKNKSRIKATTDYQEAILETDISFIIVPTPSLKNGNFSNKYVIDAIQKIGLALKKKNSYHLVVVTSTVLPGSCQKQIIPILEKYSGKKIGQDLGFCYNPEFIALGSVVRNLLEPDFILIGAEEKKSARVLANFYRKFCTNKPPIASMNLVNAEITKIALNSYITTKISFANTLAAVSEKFAGGDVDMVTNALGLDSRIGRKYLTGGVSYGGPCFPRDNRALVYLASKVKVKAPLAEANDFVNKEMIKKLAMDVAQITKKGDKVTILGLAYKPDTDVAEESAGVKIASLLSKKNLKISVWDPKAMNSARDYLGKKVTFAKNLKDSLKKSKVILITTPWRQFQNLKLPKTNPHKSIIIDCWRILDPLKYRNKASYKTIGQNL